MKRKKLTGALLTVAMVLSLAGCGLSDSSAADENSTLTIWQPTDTAAIEQWWVEKLAEWNSEHPELQVTREAIDRSDSYAYENKIMVAITSNSLPDILFVDGPTVSYYAANKIIVPITAYFSEEELSDFAASTVAQGTYNNEFYAISATESSVALYYNKDYLTECGVDVADLDSRTIDNPITWSELTEIAEKCTTDNYVGTHVIMDHGEGIPFALEPMFISNGVDLIS